MRIEVLGCSGGKTVDSNLPSFLIDGKLLLDCGSVCSVLPLERQFDIEYVFISHAHLDHICDLPFLIDNLSISGKRIKVCASGYTINLLKEHIFNDKIWPDFTRIPNVESPIVEFIGVEHGDNIVIKNYQVEFFKVCHTEGSIGFIIKDGKTSIAYTSDTNRIGELWDFFVKRDVKTVITECSFPGERTDLARVSNHFSVQDFGNELKRGKGFENIFVFHLKPHYKEKIKKELEGFDAVLIKDGDILEV